jgi:hypothetical protein
VAPAAGEASVAGVLVVSAWETTMTALPSASPVRASTTRPLIDSLSVASLLFGVGATPVAPGKLLPTCPGDVGLLLEQPTTMAMAAAEAATRRVMVGRIKILRAWCECVLQDRDDGRLLATPCYPKNDES